MVLRSRLRQFMQRDCNTDDAYSYKIRSLYFDDYKNSGYYENQDGIAQRKKYRIRFYNKDTDFIRLEIKQKNQQFIKKISCPLDAQQVAQVLSGRKLPLCEQMSPAYQEMALKMRGSLLRPSVVVEYLREAYVYPRGNVRITLDQQIVASSQTAHFLGDLPHRTPILPTGQFILEVKYDAFLPTHIQTALGLPHLQQTAFSKYYLSRDALKETFIQKKEVLSNGYDARFI